MKCTSKMALKFIKACKVEIRIHYQETQKIFLKYMPNKK